MYSSSQFETSPIFQSPRSVACRFTVGCMKTLEQRAWDAVGFIPSATGECSWLDCVGTKGRTGELLFLDFGTDVLEVDKVHAGDGANFPSDKTLRRQNQKLFAPGS
jgi:hypothetical protein